MTPVKTKPRFKCDFCKKKSVESAMVRHEKMCYRNPERDCPRCDNTGEIHVAGGGEDPVYTEPCKACEDAKETYISPNVEQ